MTDALTERERTYLWDLAESFLVRCPQCNEQALVRPTTEDRLGGARLSCAHCGHSKDWLPAATRAVVYTSTQHDVAAGEVSIGTATDWFFHLPLFLQTDCCGNTLWAYNRSHLEWLKEYVSADLRPPTRDAENDCWANAALASRLPRWMKLAKNRQAILQAISRLEAQLPGV